MRDPDYNFIRLNIKATVSSSSPILDHSLEIRQVRLTFDFVKEEGYSYKGLFHKPRWLKGTPWPRQAHTLQTGSQSSLCLSLSLSLSRERRLVASFLEAIHNSGAGICSVRPTFVEASEGRLHKFWVGEWQAQPY